MAEGPDIFQPRERFRGYTVERLLGKGGLGAVYLVRHDVLDTLFALKVLYPHTAEANSEYVKRFHREARLATRIRHPGLVAVHDCGFDEGRGLHWLVMDYVAGGDLRTALALAGRFEPARATAVVRQLASALAAAQRFKVVHRDIKPENVMVQPDGAVKLVDLGIAKADNLGESLKTMSRSILGTPVYISPEQSLSAADVDLRADVYSLGIVYFEMVAGRTPYPGLAPIDMLVRLLSEEPTPPVRSVEPSVPAAVAELIDAMCSKDRSARPGDYGELLSRLDALGYGRPEPAAEAEYAEEPAAEGSMADILKALDLGAAGPAEDVRRRSGVFAGLRRLFGAGRRA